MMGYKTKVKTMAGRMKNYLSFGGGVNSVAMYLLLMDQGMEPGDPDKGFEAIFVDHGTDWPETYEYVEMFKSKYPLTVLKTDVGTAGGKRFDNLYDYCFHRRMTPSIQFRWCTDKFKRRPLQKYHKTPCFVLIGYSHEESHRAKIHSEKGQEFRWPLIENEIDRKECKKIIKRHGLQVPHSSGCFICPFQKISSWKELRMKHACLFLKAVELENVNCEMYREKKKELKYIGNRGVSLQALVQENQSKLWAEDEYPPCECML